MDPTEIIRARGQKKSSLTKLKTYLESKDNFELNDLCVRLERLEMAFDEFSKLDILLPVDQSEFSDIEDIYIEIKILIRSKMEAMNSSAERQSNTNVVYQNTDLNSKIETIKLPKITIPAFSGNYLDWLNFRDLFKSTVHDNASLSKIQKFQYLKGLLSDSAADLIKHLPISETSYDEAWEKIEKRFDNKKPISTALLNTFLEQNKLAEPNSVKLRRIADVSDEVIRGLKALDEKANLRDLWLIHILLDKVDTETRKLWAQETTEVEFPTFEFFVEFLNNRCSYLDVSNSHSSVKTNLTNNITNVKSNSLNKCMKCSGMHSISKCYKYKAMPVSARKEFIRKHALCFRCLKGSHRIKDCFSKSVCTICNKSSHHSSLHESAIDSNMTSVKEESSVQVEPLVNSNVSLNAVKGKFVGLLPTAIVAVNDSQGRKVDCTILLDCGSQCCFISETCVQKLNLRRGNARISVNGIADSSAGQTRGNVTLSLTSKHNQNNKLSIEAFILNKLTSNLSGNNININDLDYLKSINLADPTFTEAKKVDIIIGADYFFAVIKNGQILGSENSLIAQNTLFGWVLAGKISLTNSKENHIVGIHANVNVDEILFRFWETEEIPKLKNEILNEEERFCEEHFLKNYEIDKDGRFVVKLPFFNSEVEWGNSYQIALSRLMSMERKFRENPELEKQYKSFMSEYEDLGHMKVSEDDSAELADCEKYFLPHHAVLKPCSTTTKLRVVFDASCKSSNNNSLNDALGAGAKQQPDLFVTLLNFRLSPIAFCCDVEKMYRQILVSPHDQSFQRILWRYNKTDPVQEYKLQTVTYGMKSSSFLATRSLKQIAKNAPADFSKAATMIESSFYMDDLLGGAGSVIEAARVCQEIICLLENSGLHLRKWQSNSKEFLEMIKTDDINEMFELKDCEQSKVLGLFWNPRSDSFIFKVNFSFENEITKRKFLAQSARLFDPLGLLSPCTVSIKIFYQQLWLLKLDWDSPLPTNFEERWKSFQREFKCLSVIEIPRWIQVSCSEVTIHGFSDASESAYAAVLYTVQKDVDGNTTVTILASKSKVAPLKPTSIPRLELNGALLLARLFSTIVHILQDYTIHFHAWTDSRVVLAWLSSPPRKWKPFVANRTSEIVEIAPSKLWRYVPSKQNPADIASRGVSPKALPDCKLWWHGPEWLSMSQENWPPEVQITDFSSDSKVTREKKRDSSFIVNISNVMYDNVIDLLFDKYSTLTKIVTILAYCYRFVKCCKRRRTNLGKAPSVKGKVSPIDSEERKNALSKVIFYIQNIYFSEEFKCLKGNKDLPTKSKLKNLRPFIDKDGLLRVGGRLRHSSLPFNAKHPVILPDQHKVSNYLIQQFHITYLHANITLLLNIIRQNFWIIGARKLIKSYIHKCIVCNRYQLASNNQLMGDLPRQRVTPNRAFLVCGADFAGPINMLKFRGRGARPIKGYIALFICFSTKAVHLECVSDLSSEAFIAALKRFSCRRGSPHHIHCDNATNFCGAKRKLTELYKFVSSINNNENICYFLSQQSIQWHMIPPASPHFGGLWESGIKSVKYHLKRVVGDHKLTFEELATLLSQIEALLNSRPLSPTNDDLDNLEVLTPSHFFNR